MSDQELHDLLHERVADLTMPDVSERAWGRAGRIRRRRTTAAVAGAVAAVVVTAVAVDGGAGAGRSDGPLPPASQAPTPGPSTGPDTGPDVARARAATAPDGALPRAGAVYRGPSSSAGGGRCRAPPRRSRTTVDLSAPAPDLADRPISLGAGRLRCDRRRRRHPAAAAGPDGTLRSVDTSRVGPAGRRRRHRRVGGPRHPALADGGVPRVPAGRGGVLVLTLATGAVAYGRHRGPGHDHAAVVGGHRAVAAAHQPGRVGAAVLRARRDALGGRAPRGTGGAVRRRRRRRTGGGTWAPAGMAQSWARVPGLPVVAGEATASQVLLVAGGRGRTTRCWCCERRGDAAEPAAAELLLRGGVLAAAGRRRLRLTGTPGRLVAWRVGTHEVRRVTTIGGYDPDRELSCDSSYAGVWAR